MTKIRISLGIFSLLLSLSLTAQVSITPPTVLSGTLTPAEKQLINDTLKEAASEVEKELNDVLETFSDLDDMHKRFSNAGAASAHGGTQRNYMDYKAFALTTGFGIAVSTTSLSADGGGSGNLAALEEDPNVGAAAQPLSFALGINAKFLTEGLYLTLKGGKLSVNQDNLNVELTDGGKEDLRFEAWNVGLMGDYKVFRGRQLPLGIFRWRGLAVGTGIVYQKSSISGSIDVNESSSIDFSSLPAPFDTLEGEVDAYTETEALIETNGFTIPLEVTTGLRVLWLLDLNVGAGVDLAFGSSDIHAKTEGVLNASESTGTLTFAPGDVWMSIGGEGNGPDFVRPRLTAGLGLNLGPVKLDVPLMYYLDADGNTFMAGINLGIVW